MLRFVYAAALCMLAVAAHAQTTTIYSGRVTGAGYCQLTSLGSAVSISTCTGGIPTGATFANVIVEAQAVRYRTDGTNPTTTVGMPLPIAADKVFALTDLSKLIFIGQTSGAILNIEFYK